MAEDQIIHKLALDSCCSKGDCKRSNGNVKNDIEHQPSIWQEYWDLLTAIFITVTLLVLEYGFDIYWDKLPILFINLVAFVLAGHKVLNQAIQKSLRGDFFNEFVLMSIATIGAFIIGEYEEGVAVMIFYIIGEGFQKAAVNRAKRSIKALLDIRPNAVTVVRNGEASVVHPSEVRQGEIIYIKPGEKVALDGELLSSIASFNTAALTGESKPDTKHIGEKVYAGMINLNMVAQIKVTALFKDSQLSKILELVQEATTRKSKTQLFITNIAKIYTPIIFFLALGVCLVPYLFTENYDFQTWFYRALVFLVISCPCGLVISIPLGYFGGIGLGSRNGILFKGGNFLDVMARIDTIIMDKTGTLTKGVFKVQKIESNDIEEHELLRLAVSIEKNSTHPIAKAIIEYGGDRVREMSAVNVEEIPGHGIKGEVDGNEILVGNAKLLSKYKIDYSPVVDEIVDTVVLVAINNRYAGYLVIADEIKEDTVSAIEAMHKLQIKTVMLSGDKQSVVDRFAKEIGIDEAYGDLLPQGKVEKVQKLKNEGRRIAFAGDGINDAPVVALADAGIAMGGLGSDATIETADVVIQNDQPSKIIGVIRIGKITRHVILQNILLATTVKVLVLVLGAGGMATLWEAVIADVGVALLAILNAIRIQYKRLDL